MVFGLALFLNELGDGSDLLIRDEAALDALGLTPIDLAEEHIAVAGELLGADLVDDHARVDTRGHVECDAVGDVCLDEARHHV